MSEEYIWLIDDQSALHCQPDHRQNVACTLTRDVLSLLTAYSRRQTYVDVEDIGACLETAQGTSPDLHGYYTTLNSWYRHASTMQPNPSQVDLEKVSGYNTALYQW